MLQVTASSPEVDVIEQWSPLPGLDVRIAVMPTMTPVRLPASCSVVPVVELSAVPVATALTPGVGRSRRSSEKTFGSVMPSLSSISSSSDCSVLGGDSAGNSAVLAPPSSDHSRLACHSSSVVLSPGGSPSLTVNWTAVAGVGPTVVSAPGTSAMAGSRPDSPFVTIVALPAGSFAFTFHCTAVGVFCVVARQ